MVLKIAYWATTIIAAAMLLSAVTYLTGSAQVIAFVNHLGYPQHLRLVLGVAKPAAGVVSAHPANACAAASTATRPSARVPAATRANSFPLYGSWTSKT